ncbi:Rv0361 family membrane protein [Nocardia panacis]|nr:hypothetical protein [Nocardia panacis]
MTDQRTPSDEPPIEIDQTDRRSMKPFIAAGIIAVAVLVAIVIGGLLAPAEKNVTVADRIAGAVREFVDGVNNTDGVGAAGTVCKDFDPKHSPLAQRQSGQAVSVTKIENPTADGDRAKVSVTVKFADTEHPGTWNLTRTGQKWQVCN